MYLHYFKLCAVYSTHMIAVSTDLIQKIVPCLVYLLLCSVQYAHDHCQYRPYTEDSALPCVSFAVQSTVRT